jgi:hypothetical protein
MAGSLASIQFFPGRILTYHRQQYRPAQTLGPQTREFARAFFAYSSRGTGTLGRLEIIMAVARDVSGNFRMSISSSSGFIWFWVSEQLDRRT